MWLILEENDVFLILLGFQFVSVDLNQLIVAIGMGCIAQMKKNVEKGAFVGTYSTKLLWSAHPLQIGGGNGTVTCDTFDHIGCT